MEISLLEGPMGLDSALFGLGLNYMLTSSCRTWADVPADVQERIRKATCRLAPRGNGENKFLRAVHYAWSIRAPRFWWQEMATYGVGTVTQSESTMRIASLGRMFQPGDFEDGALPGELNMLLAEYRRTKDAAVLLALKMRLPESFLQRRVWSASLAVMQNVWRQRRNHRLELWHRVCDAFVEAAPEWLRDAVFAEGGQHGSEQ